MKSIILIAPPSAGKGTVSKLLSDKYNLPHISTGDLLRNATLVGDEQGNYIKEQIKIGKLVNDNIIIDLIEKRINESDCENGYILDGFPRNISQTKKYKEMLEENGKELGLPILLDVPFEIAKMRITGRLTCPKCGSVYNIYFEETKPKKEGICNRCKSVLTKREDDTEETFDKRYNTYLEETKKVADYYQKKEKLKIVNSNQKIDLVLREIENLIND